MYSVVNIILHSRQYHAMPTLGNLIVFGTDHLVTGRIRFTASNE